MNYSIVVPFRNAEAFIGLLLPRLLEQHNCIEIIAIDSESTDATAQLLSSYPIKYIHILASEFNHGATRDMAMRLAASEIVVFLTQDALPDASDSLATLVNSFEDESVGIAYGRQLPHKDAKPFGAHARLFNYPKESRLKTYTDKSELGIKTPFCSNSFAAYRKSAYLEVGGFPTDTILSEDMLAAAKMLKAGYKVAYNADSCVYHSHDYGITEEFRRYFDTGVFHARNSWIREEFGGAGGEGARYVSSELRYLAKGAPYLIPQLFIRNAAKLFGFRLGLIEDTLALWLKKKLSMHKGYWT
ncbi:MAG TPA: glycosyltransferase [Campylobacterales bacterium]|nr:glycosyltransferase [Campylobacterales bacterium]